MPFLFIIDINLYYYNNDYYHKVYVLSQSKNRLSQSKQFIRYSNISLSTTISHNTTIIYGNCTIDIWQITHFYVKCHDKSSVN